MSPGSILDLNEARRRVERMEKECATLTDLIKELKRIRGLLLDTLTEAQRRKGDLDSGLANMRVTVHELETSAAEHEARFASHLDQFSSAAKKLLADLDRTIEDSRRKTAQAREALLTEMKAWQQAQKGRFEQFRDEHHTALADVTKAYERMRVTYDSLKMTTESLEGAIAETRTEVAKAIQALADETQEKVQALEARLNQKHSAYLQKISAYLSAMKESFKTQFEGLVSENAALRKMIKAIHVRQVILGAGIVLVILALLGVAIAVLF